MNNDIQFFKIMLIKTEIIKYFSECGSGDYDYSKFF